jgi:CubicO group peptidase (beta-lactamase class C family)
MCAHRTIVAAALVAFAHALGAVSARAQRPPSAGGSTHATSRRVATADAARQIRAFFERAAAYGQLNGAVLVAQRGQVLYEGAFGEANMEWHVPNTTDTRLEIASMTMAMTAIAVMQLVEEGKVRLDAAVSEYLPFYPRDPGDRITVEQLLTHTSGLQQDIGFADDPAQVPVAALVNADVLSNDSLVALIARRPLRFAPGTSYGYSSDGYAVLGAVIEHVTRMPYWEAIRRRVLDRAGMHETDVSVLRPLVRKRASGYAQTFGGYENALHIGVTPAGGLYSTLHDLYRFDRSLYGDSLVHVSSKERLFAVRPTATAYGWKTADERRPNGSTRRVLRTTGGLPGFAALMVRVPSDDRVIIILANTRDLEWRFDDFAVAINRILDGEPYAMPRRSAAEVLAAAVRRGERAPALRTRFAAIRRDTASFSVSEESMNRLGYHLLYDRRLPSEAIAVFSANVETFPRSANVYDSLGEAYLAHGDTAQAVTHYRRSLELNSGNTNAAAVLKRLGAPIR